jgi:hypothetical protein
VWPTAQQLEAGDPHTRWLCITGAGSDCVMADLIDVPAVQN